MVTEGVKDVVIIVKVKSVKDSSRNVSKQVLLPNVKVVLVLSASQIRFSINGEYAKLHALEIPLQINYLKNVLIALKDVLPVNHLPNANNVKKVIKRMETSAFLAILTTVKSVQIINVLLAEQD